MRPRLSAKARRTCLFVVRFVLIAIVVIVMTGQVGLAVIVLLAHQPVSRDGTVDQIVEIPGGMPAGKIGGLLKEQGLIRSALIFNAMLRITNRDSRLKAGEYLLNPAMSTMEVIQKLNEGTIVTHKVAIPEGYNLKQIAAELAGKGLADPERFLMLANNAELVYGDELPFELPISSLEGYLFPDTYYFAKEQTEEGIIRQMVKRFVDHVIPKVDLSLLDHKYTLHEVITLASIVEKEVIYDFERPLVAAVYHNRLNISMRLQADPTVRYVMTENRSRVLYSDLAIDSPYNTYRNDGLPPGPIASPGLQSILAVLEPADVDYLYFVAKNDGTHQFSRTFQEHVGARRSLGY
ncbi:MAG: endolytic transglycosylase MltG [Firmicutes bacterium]|nr:endolytic transglycosylase MltG [Bacillota bacterium]NLL88402.1 endolytic transglycosylase MltG [Bacillota bacterium]HKM17489.1 endolytic transglycosylase MltG [Limnochordia bacterium]